jgi:deoxyribodipyrimidine photo-lyase
MLRPRIHRSLPKYLVGLRSTSLKKDSSRSPRVAWRRALYINNKYFMDGRDPNSYAGVAWVFGLHDRAWPDRPTFEKVRIMTASGLERKADPRPYVEKVERMINK